MMRKDLMLRRIILWPSVEKNHTLAVDGFEELTSQGEQRKRRLGSDLQFAQARRDVIDRDFLCPPDVCIRLSPGFLESRVEM